MRLLGNKNWKDSDKLKRKNWF